MWIRLSRKLADVLDGVDLTTRDEGDVFQLANPEARVLIAEGWAEPFTPPATVGHFGGPGRGRRTSDVRQHAKIRQHSDDVRSGSEADGRFAVAADGSRRSPRQRSSRRSDRQSRRANDASRTITPSPARSQFDRIRDIRDRFDKPRPPEAGRRVEDDVREELRDSRAKTITNAK